MVRGGEKGGQRIVDKRERFGVYLFSELGEDPLDGDEVRHVEQARGAMEGLQAREEAQRGEGEDAALDEAFRPRGGLLDLGHAHVEVFDLGVDVRGKYGEMRVSDGLACGTYWVVGSLGTKMGWWACGCGGHGVTPRNEVSFKVAHACSTRKGYLRRDLEIGDYLC